MDNKSPSTKKLTDDERTFSAICDDMYTIVQLRKKAGPIIDEVYTDQTQALLKALSETEVQLQNLKTYTVPEENPLLQKSREICQQLDEATRACYKNLKLLDVLEEMEKCPIAKIIKEI